MSDRGQPSSFINDLKPFNYLFTSTDEDAETAISR